MASRHSERHESSLKNPAIEIIDLLSDDGSSEGEKLQIPRSKVGGDDDNSVDDEADGLSMYEDALDAMTDDELALGE